MVSIDRRGFTIRARTAEAVKGARVAFRKPRGACSWP
jgi:hypothetical protein